MSVIVVSSKQKVQILFHKLVDNIHIDIVRLSVGKIRRLRGALPLR